MNNLLPIPKAALEQLSTREKLICDSLNTFNQLRDFPLNAIQILEWKDSLLRIMPDLEPDKLEFVIDRMIDGQLTYKPEYGIKNLFIGLGMIELVNKVYKIKEGEKVKTNWNGE